MILTGMGVAGIGKLVEPQEVFLEEDVHIFLGPMGQGKTTLLRCAGIPFGVRVAGLAHTQMQEVVTQGAGSGKIALFFRNPADEDDGFDLTWSPGKKASPADIRSRFGVDPKNLEWMLTPGSLLDMKPEERRKMFAQGLGAEVTMDALIEAGLADDCLRSVREAAVARGWSSGIAKAQQRRRAKQNDLEALSLSAPKDSTIEIGEDKVRASALQVDDVRDLMEEDRRALEAAAMAAGAKGAGTTDESEAISALEMAISKERVKLEAAPDEIDTELRRLRDEDEFDAAKVEELNAAARTANTEKERLTNRIANCDSFLAKVANNPDASNLPCDGRYRHLPEEVRGCPRCPADAGPALEAERKACEEAIDDGIKPLLQENRQSLRAIQKRHEDRRELAGALEARMEAHERAQASLRTLDDQLAQAKRRAQAASQGAATDESEESGEDPEDIRSHLRWLEGVLAQVTAYHTSKEAWDASGPRREELQGEIEAYQKAEGALAELQSGSAADPIVAAQEKVDEICAAVLPERVTISEDWDIFYGGRRLALASKGQRATIDLALRAALTELSGFPILIVDDLDAIDNRSREIVLFEVLDKLRGRFMKILCACWSNNSEPNEALRESYPWLGRHFVNDGTVTFL